MDDLAPLSLARPYKEVPEECDVPAAGSHELLLMPKLRESLVLQRTRVDAQENISGDDYLLTLNVIQTCSLLVEYGYLTVLSVRHGKNFKLRSALNTVTKTGLAELQAFAQLCLESLWGTTGVQYPADVSSARQNCDYAVLTLLQYVGSARRSMIVNRSVAIYESYLQADCDDAAVQSELIELAHSVNMAAESASSHEFDLRLTEMMRAGAAAIYQSGGVIDDNQAVTLALSSFVMLVNRETSAAFLDLHQVTILEDEGDIKYFHRLRTLVTSLAAQLSMVEMDGESDEAGTILRDIGELHSNTPKQLKDIFNSLSFEMGMHHVILQLLMLATRDAHAHIGLVTHGLRCLALFTVGDRANQIAMFSHFREVMAYIPRSVDAVHALTAMIRNSRGCRRGGVERGGGCVSIMYEYDTCYNTVQEAWITWRTKASAPSALNVMFTIDERPPCDFNSRLLISQVTTWTTPEWRASCTGTYSR